MHATPKSSAGSEGGSAREAVQDPGDIRSCPRGKGELWNHPSHPREESRTKPFYLKPKWATAILLILLHKRGGGGRGGPSSGATFPTPPHGTPRPRCAPTRYHSHHSMAICWSGSLSPEVAASRESRVQQGRQPWAAVHQWGARFHCALTAHSTRLMNLLTVPTRFP